MNNNLSQNVNHFEDADEPFNLAGVIGFNSSVGVRILRTENDENNQILYGMGNIATIFNRKTKEQKNLLGHALTIQTIDHDIKSNFAVTADRERAILWDLQISESSIKNPMKLRMIEQPFGLNSKIADACISPCGKYLILASSPSSDITGENNFIEIQFWLWSYGRTKCDGKTNLSVEKYGELKSIRFSTNQNQEEFFAITMQHTVIFGTWNFRREDLQIYISKNRKFKNITGSCYVPNGSRHVVSITDYGKLLIWSDSIDTPTDELAITNRKNFMKSIPIRSSKINDIRPIDKFLVTVDESGDIRFYDSDLKLMFDCQFWKLPSIQCLFPVVKVKPYKLLAEGGHVENEESVDPVYTSTCPTDFSIEGRPFLISPFLLTTTTGEIILCDIVRNRLQYILCQFETEIVACDFHPSKSWILTASHSGHLVYFDCENFEKITEYRLKSHWILQDNNDEEPILVRKSNVSCVKISERGNYLIVGFENGDVQLLHPISLLPIMMSDKIINYQLSTVAIKFVRFFEDAKLCACVDSNHTVYLLKTTFENWKFIGKYRYHCKPIVNVILIDFLQEASLLTVGEDRFFAEYDINISNQDDQMILKRDQRIEQTAIITAACLAPDPTDRNNYIILTVNNEYKFKIYDVKTWENLHTYIGPIFDSPLKNIMIYSEKTGEFSNETFLLLNSDRMIGVILYPMDGNPFRYSGQVIHNKKIKEVTLPVKNGREIFVLNDKDFGGTIWRICPGKSLKRFREAENGLSPFCSYLSGGRDGWFFKEMQEMFYYMQILTEGIDAPLERFQKNILCEAKCLRKADDEHQTMKISFENVVKLYVNHKPVKGYQMEEIRNCIEYFVQNKVGEAKTIKLEDLVEILTEKGEPIDRSQAIKYLFELFQATKSKSLDGATSVMEPEKFQISEDAFKKFVEEEFTVEDIFSKLVYSDTEQLNNE